METEDAGAGTLVRPTEVMERKGDHPRLQRQRAREQGEDMRRAGMTCQRLFTETGAACAETHHAYA